MTKLEMILQIVDWEHRYKLGRLQGGGWCIDRIRELSKLPASTIAELYDRTLVVHQ